MNAAQRFATGPARCELRKSSRWCARRGIVGVGLLLVATCAACRSPFVAQTKSAAPAYRRGEAIAQDAVSSSEPAPVTTATKHAPPSPAPAQLPTSIDKKLIQPTTYTSPLAPPTLPPSAWGGGHSPALPNGAPCPCGHHHGPDCLTLEQPPIYPNPWQPDGLYGPWPYDEYIFDGGDRDVSATVDHDWTVRGLDNEDTIAHYDTRDGRTIVTPTNRVPIYAPRFASVRKVYGLEMHQNLEQIAGVDKKQKLVSQDTKSLATTAVQPLQPILRHGIKTSVGLRERLQGVAIDTAQLPNGVELGFMAHEDFLLIKRGEFDVSEKARLTNRVLAAYTWSADQSVQVVIDGQTAYEGKGNNRAAETLVYELPQGKPRLRIVKVASKSEAQPGEVIDFTIRFDNLGDQKIGNVTIVDSLTTRLEYVPDSAQCSLQANFGTQANEAESLVLRWEIQEPMKVGEGGIIRFKCKVR